VYSVQFTESVEKGRKRGECGERRCVLTVSDNVSALGPQQKLPLNVDSVRVWIFEQNPYIGEEKLSYKIYW
jgi:hypothetical protein